MALLLAILANVLGGITYYFQKTALAGWPPATLIFARMTTALPLLVLVTPRGWSARALRADWLRLVLIGVFGLALPHAIGSYGLRETQSMNAAMLIGLEPITIVSASWLLFGERLHLKQVAGMVFAIAGAVVIVSNGDVRAALMGNPATRGNLLLALHAMLWAIYTLAAKPTLKRVPPLALTSVTTAVAAFCLLPAVVWERTQFDWSRALSTGPLLSVLALGVLVSFGATVLWNISLKQIPAGKMASLIFLQPVCGAAAGIIGGEPASLALLVGSALVLLGVYAAQTPEVSGSDEPLTET